MFRRLLPVLLLAISPSLAAQTAAERTGFSQFHDSLLAAHDTAGLRRLALWYGAGAGGGESGATLALHQGLVLLALGQLGNGPSLEAAETKFRDGVKLAPDWPYSWYGLGQVKWEESRARAAQPLELGTRVGGAQLKDATADFAEALALDSNFTPAATALWEAALQLGDTSVMLHRALPALRRVSDPAPGVLLARGQAERLVGQPSASAALLRRYAEANPGSGVTRYQFARSAFLTPDSSASGAYYSGAAFDDSASVATYRSDLVLLEPDSALAGFDQSHGETRVDWLHRFWRHRDVVDLRPEGSRLQEHFRRLVFAERYFALKTNRRVYGERDMLRVQNARFDDRGLIYLRYGRPDDQVETATLGIGPNYTWRYRRRTGDLLLHFSAGGEGGEGGDLQDYRLVPSVFALRAPGASPGTVGALVLPPPWIEIALQDRCPIYPPYCGFNGQGVFAKQRILAEEKELVRTSVATATTTDANELRFLHRLDASADAVVLGEAGGAPLTHLVVALQFSKVTPPLNLRDNWLPVRVRFSAFSHTAIAGSWIIDTTLRVRDVGADSLLATGQFVLNLPPGLWQYRVAVERGDSTGQLLAGDSVWSRRLASGRLELSDLALAERERGAEWVRGPADTVFFQADRRFGSRAEIELAYEVYGAEAQEPIRTEVSFRRRGKEKSVLTLGYSEIASGPVDRVRRTISLNRLDAGPYQLEVLVKSAAGRQTRGIVDFEVLKPRESGGVNPAPP